MEVLREIQDTVILYANILSQILNTVRISKIVRKHFT